jgi:NADH-quinone oxidoreductase subunit J
MTQLAFYGFATLLILSALAVIFARNPVHSVLFLILAFFNAAGLFILLGAEFIAMILVIVYVGAVAVLFLFVVMMLRISPQTQRPIFSLLNFRKALITLFSLISYLSLLLATTALFVALPVTIELLQQGYLHHESWILLHQAFLLSPWLIFADGEINAYSVSILMISFLIGRQVAQTLIRRSFISIISGLIDSLIFMLLLGSALTAFFVLLGVRWVSSSYSEEVISAPNPPSDLMTNTQALGQIIYSDYVFAFQTAGIILLIAMVGAISLSLRKREGVKKQQISEQLKRSPANTLEMKKVPIGKGI